MKVSVIIETNSQRCDMCPAVPNCAPCFVRLLQGGEQNRFQSVRVQVIGTSKKYIGMRPPEERAATPGSPGTGSSGAVG